MKTTRVRCGEWSIHNSDVELAESMFGPGGTQAGRRWFYRYIDQHLHKEWRRKGRRCKIELVLYFRNSADATFFCLKKSQN